MEVHSDNRALVTGQASLIVDPLSGVRAAERQNPDLAPLLALAPTPAGPAGRIGAGVQHCYFVWNFSEQRSLAEQFLVDLVTDYREAFLHSEFYNLPTFPGAIGDIGGLLAADPADRRASTRSWPTPTAGSPTPAIPATTTPPSRKSSTTTSCPGCSALQSGASSHRRSRSARPKPR